MIKELRRAYPSRYGTPTITHVSTAIFTKTYFAHCMACNFCHDSCCSYGVDVGADEIVRLESYGDALGRYIGIPRTEWFTREHSPDAEFPGGSCARTQVVDGACVFLNRSGRGCWIHSFCLEQGLDFHELKPMVSCLFPITFDNGLLLPSDDVEDNSLICLSSGVNLYRGVRNDLSYYFGEAFVSELDELEAVVAKSVRA
jgi:hypothetical protein